MSLNYNFIWLLCYLLVLVGLAWQDMASTA